MEKKQVDKIVKYFLRKRNECDHDSSSYGDCPRCLAKLIRKAIEYSERKSVQKSVQK